MAEDRRIALAALAVTAIVGVGAPLGTVIATNKHDSNRLRAEQAQLDRTELRAVLDSAATALDIAETHHRQVSAPCRTGGGAARCTHP